MEENLTPVPRQEVLAIMKAVQESAVFGATNSDIAEARKIFEKIAFSAKEFVAKISRESTGSTIEGNGISDLKQKQNEIQAMISAVEKKEKEITESIGKFKFEAEENRRKIAGLEKENYQAEARLRELKGHLARLSLEEDKMRLRTDELKREETEAGALLGRQFLESLEATSRLNLDVAVSLSYQDREKFLRQAERLKIRLEDCGAIGGEVLDEYNQAKQRDEGYEKELNDLAAAEKSLREIMAELADKIESDFFGGVEKINEEFRKFFVSVFGGGKAELILAKIAKRKTKKKNFPTRQDFPLRFTTRRDGKLTWMRRRKKRKRKRGLKFLSATPRKEFLRWKCCRAERGRWWPSLCFSPCLKLIRRRF